MLGPFPVDIDLPGGIEPVTTLRAHETSHPSDALFVATVEPLGNIAGAAHVGDGPGSMSQRFRESVSDQGQDGV